MAEETKAYLPQGFEGGSLYSNRKQNDVSVPLFLHENADLSLQVEEESCCSAHSTLVSDQNTTFTSLKLHGNIMTLKGTRIQSWPSSTEVACWYDTFPFTTMPIPLPHHYDELKRSYVVYGNLCSVECALAYLHRESRRHDLWERVVLFEDMMHKVFQLKIDGKEPAPPFLTLTRFGGFYSIDEFRQSFTTLKLSVITPPFIMYPLVIQERHRKRDQGGSGNGNGNGSGSLVEAVHKEETVLSTGHVLRGLRRPQKMVVEDSTKALSVLPLHDSSSSSEAENGVTSMDVSVSMPDVSGTTVPPLSDLHADVPATFTTTATVPPIETRRQGRGRGRGRGRGGRLNSGNTAGSGVGGGHSDNSSNTASSGTMLTHFLVVNPK